MSNIPSKRKLRHEVADSLHPAAKRHAAWFNLKGLRGGGSILSTFAGRSKLLGGASGGDSPTLSNPAPPGSPLANSSASSAPPAFPPQTSSAAPQAVPPPIPQNKDCQSVELVQRKNELQPLDYLTIPDIRYVCNSQQNPGLLCYRHSVNCALAHLPPFINFLFMNSYQCNCSTLEHQRCSVCRLNELFNALWNYPQAHSSVVLAKFDMWIKYSPPLAEDAAAIHKANLVKEEKLVEYNYDYLPSRYLKPIAEEKFRWMEGIGQEDAQEYLIWFVSLLVGNPKWGPNAMDLFMTIWRSEWYCNHCGQTNGDRRQTQTHLGLRVTAESINSAAIYPYIINFRDEPDAIQRRCQHSGCSHFDLEQKRPSTRRIVDAPQILIVHMELYGYNTDATKGQVGQYKSQNRLNYPQILNLASHTSSLFRGGAYYDLRAVVVHNGGSAIEGHYMTYAQSKGQTYKFNSHHITPSTSATMLRPPNEESPFLLFYIRRKPWDAPAIPATEEVHSIFKLAPPPLIQQSAGTQTSPPSPAMQQSAGTQPQPPPSPPMQQLAGTQHSPPSPPMQQSVEPQVSPPPPPMQQSIGTQKSPSLQSSSEPPLSPGAAVKRLIAQIDGGESEKVANSGGYVKVTIEVNPPAAQSDTGDKAKAPRIKITKRAQPSQKPRRSARIKQIPAPTYVPEPRSKSQVDKSKGESSGKGRGKAKKEVNEALKGRKAKKRAKRAPEGGKGKKGGQGGKGREGKKK